jgi:lipopolysaccharide transport system ATP-binding protein
MKPIIEVRNLSKKYKIGERQRYLSLRDSVSNLFSSKSTEGPPFWALDDVSFDIHAGESVGIIGRNGAGKSTLLKILSRITPPTKGSVILRGRIASLLEVGTGFHSELTGRENVFMNGSILGLKKREIEAKFDEIVDFSGVEQFIDTPLKHYSSGMQLRLAFAVAAHLEPEILVIDEVLAVGDMEFQKRCLGKMDEVSRSGRTVIFVSHNMSVLKQLCMTTIVLENGQLKMNGDTESSVRFYERTNTYLNNAVWENNIDKNSKLLIKRIEICDKGKELKTQYLNSDSIFVTFHLKSFKHLENVTLGFDLVREGIIVLRSRHTDWLENHIFETNQELIVTCKIPSWFLNIGNYEIRPLLSIHCVETLTSAYEIGLGFDIELDMERSPFHIALNKQNHPGVLFPMLEWE